MRSHASILCATMLVSLSAFAQNHTEVLVTEADFKKWDDLRFEKSLLEARTEQDRSQRAKHKEKYEAAVKASGLSETRRMQIEEVLTEIEQAILEAENGAFSQADLDTYLAAYKPQTVAVARKHLDALRDPDHMDRARAQARTEAIEARKGDVVKPEQIQGVWVVDADATIRSMLGAMADLPEMASTKADIEKSLEGTSYEFKGDQVTSTVVSNGKKSVSKARFRIEGHKLLIGDDAPRQSSLDIGMKDGRLVLGTGFATAHYKKKP